MVDPQIGGFRVRIGLVHLGRCVDGGNRGRDIRLSGGDHGGTNRRIGAEDIGRLLDRRLLAPVIGAAVQRDALPRLPIRQGIGAGADGFARKLDRGFRGHDGQQRQKQRQDRLGRFGGEVDGVFIDHGRRDLDPFIVTGNLAGDLAAAGAFEGMLHVLGVKGAAVRKGDPLTKVETPGFVVHLFPAFGKTGLEPFIAAHIELGQGLADIAQNDPSDIGSRRHAGLDQIRLLAQNDGHIRVLRESRAERRRRPKRARQNHGLFHSTSRKPVAFSIYRASRRPPPSGACRTRSRRRLPQTRRLAILVKLQIKVKRQCLLAGSNSSSYCYCVI